MCDYPTLARIADALERIAEQMSRELPEVYTATPGESPDMSEALDKQYQVGYDDGYQDGLVDKLGFRSNG